MTDILQPTPPASERDDEPATPGVATAVQDVPLGDRKTPPPGRVTWEEFLAWCDEDTRAEWVDGRVIVMSPSSTEHIQVIFFLSRLLIEFVEARDLGEIYLFEYLMRLETRPSGRVPDIAFIAREHLDRAGATYLNGPADLVVEVVSPDSDARDHGDKFVEYEAAGVPEYWLIDPIRRQATFYALGEDGRYRPGRIEDGVYRSRVLDGFWLRVEWLWQRPLPRVRDIARELGA
jgi:Uma2 family endonuclease